jgi:hypothetical protein
MSDTGLGWASLLDSLAPAGCWLKAALFTTYDRTDERLLVEHLLPQLLKLSREPDGEGAERQYFLLELDRRLKQLHDKLVVVSSTAREEPADSDDVGSGAYGWIWRSIRPLTVGRRGKAVQHAKLWMLHWGASESDGSERLELVVSSANLTRSAFRGQLQAAWRVCLELDDRPSEARCRGWGVLPSFLRELSASAEEETRLDPFIDLLARANAPDGVTFVASVPGRHSRQVLSKTPWGLKGLGRNIPTGSGTVKVSVLSPYLGAWSADAFQKWCEALESSPKNCELVWIDKDHPWARADRWLAPKDTLQVLTTLGATLLRLRHEPNAPKGVDRFHDEHRPADDRWSHAKVYALRRRNSRRLLVTSANFSAAAWGSVNGDGLAIENFELGVCVVGATWPFEHLEKFSDLDRAASLAELPVRGSMLLQWARADWDGTIITIECRSADGREVTGAVQVGTDRLQVSEWSFSGDGRLRSAQVPWADAKAPPSFAQLACEGETLNVPVFDARPAPERETSVPPEVDEKLLDEMRDLLLFEQYGGQVPGDEPPTSTGDEVASDPGQELEDGAEAEIAGGSGRADSYAVPAFVLARRHLAVIDNWWDKVASAAKRGIAQFERVVLRRDGELLVEAFRRQAERDSRKEASRGLGATLAAEELALRLKHFPEA